jgi:hypothetical protein
MSAPVCTPPTNQRLENNRLSISFCCSLASQLFKPYALNVSEITAAIFLLCLSKTTTAADTGLGVRTGNVRMKEGKQTESSSIPTVPISVTTSATTRAIPTLQAQLSVYSRSSARPAVTISQTSKHSGKLYKEIKVQARPAQLTININN